MQINDYFETVKGRGVLSTADAEGRVDAAVFARPHVFEDGTVGFVMPDRLTHAHLGQNPHAAYLFMEEGPGYKGVRLFLSKVAEEKDSERVEALRRRRYDSGEDESRYLVTFKVDKVLALTGKGTCPVE